ncbi:MAG: TetR/AcrR family transcriptional regulator [Planctomycetota bacterium]
MPRPASITEDQLLDAAAGVFRSHGYAGASIAMLAEATGLQKASLYHRYPDGKAELACAVVERGGSRLGGEIASALEKPGTFEARIRGVGRAIDRFYDGGDMPCTLDTLSLASDPRVLASLRTLFETFRDLIADAAIEPLSLTQKEAHRRVEAFIVQMQGALVMARVTGSKTSFKNVVAALPLTLGIAS